MLAACPAWAAEPAGAQSFEFNVYLGKRAIGTHRFDVFRTAGTVDRVESSATFDVRLLGVRVYRYRHQAYEDWQRGCLRRLQSSTDDNGDQLNVNFAPTIGCVQSYAYWDPALVNATLLLNPQTGQQDEVSFRPMGSEQIEVLGQPVTAQRYRLVSKAYTIDLWYSSAGQWLQLLSTTSDGRQLHYRLTPRAARS